MLIKFQSKGSAPFSMLVDDATPLLRGMGQGENFEGAVSGENLRDALTQLESALRTAALVPKPDALSSEGEDPDKEPPVDISVRAAPLLEMMRKAQASEGYVMWTPE